MASKAAAIKAAGQPCIVTRLGKHGWHAGDEPRGRSAHVYGVLGILKIIYIRGIVLYTSRLSRNQLGELSRERDLGRLRHMQEGNLVEHICQPLAFLLPIHVDAPQSVVHWL